MPHSLQYENEIKYECNVRIQTTDVSRSELALFLLVLGSQSNSWEEIGMSRYKVKAAN